jgi:Ring finger domain
VEPNHIAVPRNSKVIKSEHFYYAIDKVGGTRDVYPLVSPNTANIADNDPSGTHNEGFTCGPDIEAANHSSDPEPTLDVYIKIPSKPSGEPRYVDGSCSICLFDYKVGDTIIRSTRRVCHHAFHDDCILLWLSKGKKRCPICRNFFVPGSKIDDKKVITHDAGDLQASMAGGNAVEDDEEIDDEADRLASIQEDVDLVNDSPTSVSNHGS